MLTPRRGARLAWRAVVRRGGDRAATLAHAAREAALVAADWRERRLFLRQA